MASKTFKIGEYAQGGIITVMVMGSKITVIGKEWDFSKGSKRSSDQSNAKEFTRTEISGNDSYNELYDCISSLSTHYWAKEIIKWVSSKTKLKQSIW